MKTIRNSILCLSAFFLTASLLHGQELSKYRGFSLGTSLPDVLKLSEQKLGNVKTIHVRPVLIQELTWWPLRSAGTSARPDSVEQILFSFSNGDLYKISVTYGRASTEGLTVADMVKSISAKYGPATSLESEVDSVLNERYNMKQKSVASWEDSKYFFNLVRSSFTDHLGLVIYSKRLNADAELHIAEAVKLEEQDGPQKEADRLKKQTDNLETARQKNRKIFRP